MARIKQIEYTDQYIAMMDMEVEDAHCFYANGILVHNCSQEMLVLGNLAQEPTLLDPIRNGEDIHKAVATKMFGHYDKTKRTQAKNINFCIAPNSMVSTPTGQVPMYSIEDGDLVLTPQGAKRCIKPHYTGLRKVIHVELTNGYTLNCSKTHKVATLQDNAVVWVVAPELEGHVVITEHGNFSVKSVEERPECIDMMDMEVEDAHCFYANGILVHNCSNYGGGASTIANRLGIHIDEAKALLEKYKKAIPRVTEWQERQIKQGRQEGIVYSYFGRPRYLAQYFGSADRSKRSYAERCCKNSPIQATGGDIIRIAICKYWNKYLTDAEFRENVMFANTVHDEINLYVKKEWAHKAFLALKGLMEMHPKGWQLPLRVSPSVGTSWGAQIEMTNVSEDGVWTPDVEIDEDLKLLESDKVTDSE